MTLPLREPDHLPEYTPYQDTGCELAPACLRCPLPRCKHDPDPAGRRDWLRRSRQARRYAQIREAYRRERPSIRELARRFRVSIRTVYRALGLRS